MMKAHDKNDGLRTQSEWGQLGYKLKEGATGVKLLINRYSEDVGRYYSENEVEEEEEWVYHSKLSRAIQRRMEYEADKEERFIKVGVKKGKKEQFLKDLDMFGYKIVMVYINEDPYSKMILYYVVPKSINAGHIGKFPYDGGIVEGMVIDEKIDIEGLKELDWFPDRMKMMY